jgi:hypothetical protein
LGVVLALIIISRKPQASAAGFEVKLKRRIVSQSLALKACIILAFLVLPR